MKPPDPGEPPWRWLLEKAGWKFQVWMGLVVVGTAVLSFRAAVGGKWLGFAIWIACASILGGAGAACGLFD